MVAASKTVVRPYVSIQVDLKKMKCHLYYNSLFLRFNVAVNDVLLVKITFCSSLNSIKFSHFISFFILFY